MFEFKRILKKVFYKPEFYIIYVPPLDDASTHLSCICNEVFKIQEGYLQSHFAKITLLVDEAQEGIPSGTSKLNPSHGALIIAKMGRTRGINLVVVSQRIKAVDIGVLDENGDVVPVVDNTDGTHTCTFTNAGTHTYTVTLKMTGDTTASKL